MCSDDTRSTNKVTYMCEQRVHIRLIRANLDETTQEIWIPSRSIDTKTIEHVELENERENKHWIHFLPDFSGSIAFCLAHLSTSDIHETKYDKFYYMCLSLFDCRRARAMCLIFIEWNMNDKNKRISVSIETMAECRRVSFSDMFVHNSSQKQRV
jgi:hypothetical protein